MSAATDVTLTTAERNAVFQWVQQGEYNPADFRREELQHNERHRRGTDQFRVSSLIHKVTNFFFSFGGIYVIYSPGDQTKRIVEEHLNDWSIKHSLFMLWLRRLTLEVNAPDLWASVAAEGEMIEASNSQDLNNKAFSRDERKTISAKLDVLKSLLLNSQSFDREQAQFIEERFTYMQEASERLGRKDSPPAFFNSVRTSFMISPTRSFGIFAAISESPNRHRGGYKPSA